MRLLHLHDYSMDLLTLFSEMLTIMLIGVTAICAVYVHLNFDIIQLFLFLILYSAFVKYIHHLYGLLLIR